MDINNTSFSLETIKSTYDNLSYLDQYSGSVILFVLITIAVIIIVSYFYTMTNLQPIVDDWTNQRCKPFIMPFAGFINKPDGTTAFDYTYQNFNYCLQNVLSGVSGTALQPLTYLTNVLQNIANLIQNSIQNIRAMFDKIRTSFQNVTQEIMGRLMNVMIPLMQIIISFKDLVSKIQGTMTAGLFTLLGSYYTLNSLLGAIAQFIITILIALASMIAAFWLFPVTWGAAIANTSIFVAIAIPMSIILAFMTNVLHVKTDLTIPKVKCFDKNTLILLNDGNYVKISDIKNGHILSNNNLVTSIIKVSTEGSIMYKLDNIIVSDSHIVFFNGQWIRTRYHPNAVRLDHYDEKYLYCLNTTNKTIEIGNYIFTDWDEIYGDYLREINTELIHNYYDYGFIGSTEFQLKNGEFKYIKDLEINDILSNGEKIYGIVEINGANIQQNFQYNLGKFSVFGHIPFEMNCIKTPIFKQDKLYNILTFTDYFNLNGVLFHDYNKAIDSFLENN
jgi:hypothetical protein